MLDRRNETSEELLNRAVAATRQLPVPSGPSAAIVSHTSAALREDAHRPKASLLERIHIMPWTSKAIVTLAVAASVLVCLALSNLTGASRAFAQVAKAIENIRTATYDVTTEMKDPMNGTSTTSTMKGFFLAPSRERLEMSTSFGFAKDKTSSIMILDHQAMKGLALAPEQKLATTIDLTKIKKPAGPSNPFDMVRQLVKGGNSGPGQKIESLGKKEIEGHEAIGFRTQSNLVDETFWADPETSRLVLVEFDYPGGSGHGVMNNFRYDMDLDPSLFSLEPPAGYTVSNLEVTMPVEKDLINTLRIIAEHNDGTFPAALGLTNKEYQQAMQAVSKEEMEKYVKTPETQKLMEKLKAQYDKDQAGFMKQRFKAVTGVR